MDKKDIHKNISFNGYKKLICIILILVAQTLAFPKLAKADFDPRMKALGLMAVYGAVGGTLLGTASLAFGAEGRSVAKGASLGLYAGLLFGGYVVGSHVLKQYKSSETPAAQPNYYPGTTSPYEEDSGQEEEGGFFRWNPYQEINAAGIKPIDNHSKMMGPKAPPLFYFNLFKLSF